MQPTLDPGPIGAWYEVSSEPEPANDEPEAASNERRSGMPKSRQKIREHTGIVGGCGLPLGIDAQWAGAFSPSQFPSILTSSILMGREIGRAGSHQGLLLREKSTPKMSVTTWHSFIDARTYADLIDGLS